MPVYPTRRMALAMVSATLATSATPALSGGEGGGGDRGSSSSTAPRSSPTLEERYSQAEFAALSKAEIRTLSFNGGRVTPGGKRVKVDGFSNNMMTWLVAMMAFDRASTRRLIRDMAKIKDKAKRKARLGQEITKIKSRITKLEAAKERATKRGSQHAIDEARTRLDQAKEYLEGVETWAQHPHEGTR